MTCAGTLRKILGSITVVLGITVAIVAPFVFEGMGPRIGLPAVSFAMVVLVVRGFWRDRRLD